MSKISSSKKKSSLKNIQVEKQITIDNVIINTIFISIIYNIFVLGYILNLEGKDCNCFRDWRHNFMKYYSISLIIWGILTIGLKLYKSNNQLFKMINSISIIAYLINIWCLYSYVGILDYEKCECAIFNSKKMHYFLYLFRYILVGLIFLSLLCSIVKIVAL